MGGDQKHIHEMSNSTQTHVTMEDEELPLTTVPGTGDAENNDTCNQVVISSTEQDTVSCCKEKHYRKLAICSIICGISCIGIKALIYSVKAETSRDPAVMEKFSQRAKKFSIISLVTWFSILAIIPLLMALISYLLTLQD
ncbi:uncharacterized protein LOC103367336 [Stegastes partitus]|uniref:Uncharacterized protein LOC103367336 n=1 Tax=Stegastes partitus TaxID=144197 RepID=A0A9Y4KN62_9TELE|nr:PREDICTED: uncharacterized protein LOC103367336 [Stegastes partitus]